MRSPTLFLHQKVPPPVVELCVQPAPVVEYFESVAAVECADAALAPVVESVASLVEAEETPNKLVCDDLRQFVRFGTEPGRAKARINERLRE